MIDALLLDLDGTLLDTAPDFETALNNLLGEQQQPPLDSQSVKTMVSNGSAHLVAQAFNIDATHPRFDGLRNRLLELYANCLTDRTGFYPGMRECLHWCTTNGVAFGVVTNKPLRYAEQIMQQLEFDPGVLICPDHVDQPKPDPQGILLACSELQVRPAHSLYVGDHLRDVQAAKAAGCISAAAAWGYLAPNENPLDWGANYLLQQPTHLQPLLESLK